MKNTQLLLRDLISLLVIKANVQITLVSYITIFSFCLHLLTLTYYFNLHNTNLYHDILITLTKKKMYCYLLPFYKHAFLRSPGKVDIAISSFSITTPFLGRPRKLDTTNSSHSIITPFIPPICKLCTALSSHSITTPFILPPGKAGTALSSLQDEYENYGSNISSGNIEVPNLTWSRDEIVPSYNGTSNCFAIQLFVIDNKNEMRSADFLPKGSPTLLKPINFVHFIKINQSIK